MTTPRPTVLRLTGKESGLGREGGRVGMEEFLEYQYLAIPVR